MEDFYKKLKEFDYTRTICLDETSIYLNMTLTYGRSKSGTRVIKKTNKYPYKRFNLLCAISSDKVVGWKLYPQRKGGHRRAGLHQAPTISRHDLRLFSLPHDAAAH